MCLLFSSLLFLSSWVETRKSLSSVFHSFQFSCLCVLLLWIVLFLGSSPSDKLFEMDEAVKSINFSLILSPAVVRSLLPMNFWCCCYLSLDRDLRKEGQFSWSSFCYCCHVNSQWNRNISYSVTSWGPLFRSKYLHSLSFLFNSHMHSVVTWNRAFLSTSTRKS